MGMLYSRSISEDQHKVLKAQPLSNQPTIPINTYCYITIFVCHNDSLAAAKKILQANLVWAAVLMKER